MSITQKLNAFVDNTAVSIGLSQMFGITAASNNPAYLVLSVLDRNEYTAGASGATGSLSGNGHTLALSNIGGDGRGAGIVFTYQAFTGRYYNSIYGYFDQLTYNASSSLNDMANLSLYGTGSIGLANTYASNAWAMMQVDPQGYLGSATVVTAPGFTGAVPAQATPSSIAAVANSFVGQAWNMNGCWVLASTIAAEAGASLPVQSTLIGLPGQANGEWIVAFNGPVGQSGNWQSMVTAGEMVVIGTPGGGGHITTCVSGSGSSAMLVDNITYVNGSGQVMNQANDGSPNDVVVASPHSAAQEWAGVQASSVVIYELDTPIVSNKVASDTLACTASQSLAALFGVTDPANRPITAWQVYDTAASDSFLVNGIAASGHSATTALTAASLGSISLVADATPTSDTLEIRAFNGLYWGDWDALPVSVTTATTPLPAPSPPALVIQTPGQTWLGGKPMALTLPASTFKDPQGQTLTYSARLSNGQALPGWLGFDAATDSFSGTAPINAQTLGITVTATDSSGLSATDSFSVAILGTPILTVPTPGQTWIEGKAISLVLPANTFTDPQGQALSFAARLSNGQALPSWLHFDAATDSFSGTTPTTAQNLSIAVTATDGSGLSASESFAVAVQAPPPPVVAPGIRLSAQTPDQTWVDGQTIDLKLPGNTFTDALGLRMSFAAYEVSGPNVTSWLRFNPNTNELFGKVPATATGSVTLAVMATDPLHMMATDLFNVTLVAAPGHAPQGSGGSLLGGGLHFIPLPTATVLPFHT